MNNFFKSNISSIIILTACLALLVVLIAISGKQIINPLTVPRVGTPMVDIDDSLKEKEIVSQLDLSLATVSNPNLNDDAMSYSDFVASYGDKRIQFDDSCRATPNVTSLSVGDTLILDNRSSKIQAVKFIDDLYALPPYHIRVFKLERQGIFNIDCGTSKNVAEIIVH